jgi:DNA-binding transcriptional LysR family regulator
VLTVHQLTVLVTVADTGSVRAAAGKLVVTQPAVSASLAALERQVGVPLTARAGRGIALTDAGEVLTRYARQIVSLVDEAVAATQGLGGSGPGTIRLGVATAAAHHLVGQLLAGVNDLSPSVGIELEVGNRVRIWQLLNARAVDLAVTGRPPVSGGFDALARRDNELILVCRPGAVWASRLGEATWLLREPGSGTRATAMEVIAQLGIDPPVAVIGSNIAIKTAAEAGLGVALLPREAVEEALASRTLARVDAPETPLNRPWYVVARAGEQLPAPARRWLDHLLGQPDGRFVALGPGPSGHTSSTPRSDRAGLSLGGGAGTAPRAP